MGIAQVPAPVVATIIVDDVIGADDVVWPGVATIIAIIIAIDRSSRAITTNIKVCKRKYKYTNRYS